MRVPGDSATLKLLLLTSFAAAATVIAYADASVTRIALLTVFNVFNVICCCDCDCTCYAAIATPTSSFATITAANASADGSVAHVAVWMAVIVRMLLLHI